MNSFGERVKSQKINLSKNALTVLRKRYLKKDREGNIIETPEDLFGRVANNIAQADKLYERDGVGVKETEEEFYELLASLKFLPNSPCLRGAGRELQQLSACFVLPIEDDMESIFTTLKNAAMVHKTGGGTGFDFSRLRPKGDIIHSTGNATPGPLSFLRLYNAMAEEVTQGGVRMGANMGMLRADHPDIEDFISSKADLKSITNFNISISAPDHFMKAVEEDGEYELINPRTQEPVKKIKAKTVFDKACYYGWQNGDPGMIFIDRINDSSSNPTPKLGRIEATNPCGEQPLLPYESCVLGSINLANHLKSNELGKKEIDFSSLAETVKKAVHFLDNVIDMNRYAVPEIEKMTKGLRRIGLGVMGFADMLIDLGVPYGSEEAIDAAQKIMKFINDSARAASRELAKTRGAYPFFKDSLDYEKGEPPIRNVARTTIAPTGTIAVIADCSSGIEPIFALVHRRHSIWKGQKAEVEMLVVDKRFEKIAKDRGFYHEALMKKVAEKGSVQDFEGVPAEVKRIFVTAHDLTPKDHVLIQAAFQRHIDNAVSKTINFPHEATVKDVKGAYLLAYKTGCKGITVYRDGSRNHQVLEVGKEEKKLPTPSGSAEQGVGAEASRAVPVSHYLYPRERPVQVTGTTYKTRTSYGSLFVTINEDEEGKPFEVFAAMGKAGGFFAAKVEAISRMISLGLRSGLPPSEIIDQLKGIRGPSPIWNEGELILSVPDAIAKIIEKHLGRHQTKLSLDFKKEKIENENPLPQISGITKPDVSLADWGEAPGCPECGGPLTFQEGCFKCNSCSYSKCG